MPVSNWIDRPNFLQQEFIFLQTTVQECHPHIQSSIFLSTSFETSVCGKKQSKDKERKVLVSQRLVSQERHLDADEDLGAFALQVVTEAIEILKAVQRECVKCEGK